MKRFFIPPRDSGEGGPHKVRWEGPRILPRKRSVDAPCTTLRSLKRATGGPPPPLSRGRMSLIVLAARFCARAVARQSFDLVTAGLDPAVHAEVSRRHTSGKMHRLDFRMDCRQRRAKRRRSFERLCPAMTNGKNERKETRKKGKRNADKRSCKSSSAPRKADVAIGPALRARLACRRSTTALA